MENLSVIFGVVFVVLLVVLVLRLVFRGSPSEEASSDAFDEQSDDIEASPEQVAEAPAPEPEAHPEPAPEPEAPPSPEPEAPAAEEEPAAPEAVAEEPATADDAELKKQHEKAARTARVIVRDILNYNQDKVKVGREKANLGTLLKEAIDLGEKHYKDKVPDHIQAESNYFRESLIEILADGDEDLL